MNITLKITGMHCASCKSLIEDVCMETAGVRSCSVSLETGLAAIEADDNLDLSGLIEEIKRLDEKYTVERAG